MNSTYKFEESLPYVYPLVLQPFLLGVKQGLLEYGLLQFLIALPVQKEEPCESLVAIQKP